MSSQINLYNIRLKLKQLNNTVPTSYLHFVRTKIEITQNFRNIYHIFN